MVGDVLVALDEASVVSVPYADILAALRRPPPQALRFVRVPEEPPGAPSSSPASSAASPPARKSSFSFPRWRRSP